MKTWTIRKTLQISLAFLLVCIIPISIIAMFVEDSDSQFVIIYTAIYTSNIALMLDISQIKKQRLLLLKTLKRYRQRQGEALMLPNSIKELVGSTATVSTINGFYKGEIVAVEDDWVKLVKVTKKGSNEYFVKAEMIMALTVKKVNEVK